jgi:VWFA-related protein
MMVRISPPFSRTNWYKCVLSFSFFFLIFAFPAYSQQPPAKSPAVPTVLSNVDEVSLDVVVRTKKNKPVTDLTPQDLAITDNGTPVKITSLRLINGDSVSDHNIALVFDRLDSSAAGNARDIAGKILKKIPEKGFSFCVMSVVGRLKLYQDFTSDRKVVTGAIRAATEASRDRNSSASETAEKTLLALVRTGKDESGAHATPEQRRNAEVLMAALQDSQRVIQEQHTTASLAGLLALGRAERRIPGRKVVIYFSQGSRLNVDSREMLGSIAGAANRSGVSLYTIDTNVFDEQAAQGLLATMAMGNSMSLGTNRVSAPQAPTGPPPMPVGDVSTPGMHSMMTSQFDRFEIHEGKGSEGPLSALASDTDGGFVPAGANPKKMVRNMLQDLNTYYEVSYVPPFKEYDGTFRSVAVKPVRPKLKVHTRAGYFAVPPQNGSSFKLFEAPLLKVFDDPQLPSDVKFQWRVLQLGDVGGGSTNTLVVEVPLSQLTTVDDPNTNLYSLHASIVARIKDRSGNVIEHFSEDLPRHGALDTKNATQYANISMQRHFFADPGEYTMEAAVLDRNSGKIGATRASFNIAQPASNPSLSDLTLVQRMDPFPEELDPTEPLRFGDRKVVADITGKMSRGVKKIDLFSLVHTDAGSGNQPVLELTVMRNNEAIAQVPLQLRSVPGSAAIPYVASIQAAALPPGDYQLIETLTEGEKASEKSVSFRIEGPQIATAASPSPTNAADRELIGQEMTSLNGPGIPDGSHQLVITSLPPGSVPPPSAEELQTIVAAARKHSVKYSKRLPNFVCVQVTSRSVDSSGNGRWKHRDSLTELLRYVDSVETRTMIERNGERTNLQRKDLDQTWATSVGEFGHLLNLIFADSSKADFQWKGAATLGGDNTVQVLSFKVSGSNATMVLNDNTRQIGVGFHGLVYIDAATGGIRRATIEADDIPRDFSIRGASMSVDYDFVTIAQHDYLMPVRATVALRRGRRQIDLNEIAFRGYRHYSSETKIITGPVAN